ncbi:MAG TPA: hypothetical protein VNF06_02175 [Candidatus Aquilonibacter sp.]|nr:hypothetical protein [Candidatus Aquilonibacter sp.]
MAPKRPKTKVVRSLRRGIHNFGDLCIGFEELPAIKKIFGKETESVLGDLKVKVAQVKGYAYIDDSNGRIVISEQYLKSGSELYLTLDMIHELVHIKQWREEKDLFDEKYSYVDRPTEIEAYKIAAREAKRMGLKGKALRDYLVVDWVSKEDFERLLKSIGVK